MDTSIKWPKIGIVMTSYNPASKKYLDLAMKSFELVKYPREKIDFVLVTRPDYCPTYEGVRTVYPMLDKFSNCVGLNYGAKQLADDCELLFIVNDDVIFTPQCLMNMAPWVMGPTGHHSNIIVSPVSNCDLGWLYSLGLGYHESDQKTFTFQKRFYNYEELEPHFDGLMNAYSYYPPGMMYVENLCLYANMMPMSLWKHLGGFDETFLLGYDDTDFVLRAKEVGTRLGVALNSMITHFAGATSSVSLSDEDRAAAKAIFDRKWSNS